MFEGGVVGFEHFGEIFGVGILKFFFAFSGYVPLFDELSLRNHSTINFIISMEIMQIV